MPTKPIIVMKLGNKHEKYLDSSLKSTIITPQFVSRFMLTYWAAAAAAFS